MILSLFLWQIISHGYGFFLKVIYFERKKESMCVYTSKQEKGRERGRERESQAGSVQSPMLGSISQLQESDAKLTEPSRCPS